MLLTIVGCIVFSYLYTSRNDFIFVIIAIIYSSVLVVLYSITVIIAFFRLRYIYQDGLYKVTASLLRNLKNNVASDEVYPKSHIKEMEELNVDLKQVTTMISNATMISNDLSNAYIPLNFISEENRLVTLESFKSELRNLIYCSQNFRNVLVEAFYDLNEDTLNEEEEKRIVSTLKENLLDYPHILFVPNDNRTGFYIFLPHINSFSHIQERLLAAMKHISVTKKTFDGLMTINARFSIVCYPYSNIDELFPDLLYAKRQGQNINLYLPNRLTSLSENKIMQNSLNLNNMSRVLEKISNLNLTASHRGESKERIHETLQSLITYLDIDYSGVLVYDDINEKYVPFLSAQKGKELLFKEYESIDPLFIDAMNEVSDVDNSYYFSSRSHAGVALAKFLDKINASGGFFYLIHNQGKVISAIYFFNKVRDLVIDSYIREALYILSYRIGDYLLINDDETKISETYKEINNVLMKSEYSLYRVDRNTLDLVGFSSHFQTFFPKAKFGEKCYKVLYGLDSQCPNCPLRTSRKMISVNGSENLETSLTLNDSNNKLIRMLVKRIKDENTGDRFDQDLLINSFGSLKISLNDLYSVGSRGYMLVLRIDNHEELLDHAGSEGLLFLIRSLIKEIKEVRRSNANIYYFSTQAIAILLPEIGQIDLMNYIEKIYDVSKKRYQFKETDYSFKITYLPYSFPQQYSTAEDFLKYSIRHYNSLDYEYGKDQIDFPDSDYVRSASRNEFMLSVIEEQFGNKTFSVALQPMVRASDKSIYGAEILIRLSDNYRNSVFNANELIKVAAQNGKISLISNALMNYIGELYQQHGLTVFKVFGFNRLTMNTDFSYFDDPTFFQTLYDLFSNYHLPRDFLGFEITEQEIYMHIDQFKKISKGILNHHIALIVDQYSGEYLSINQLKALGFTEIKIGRNLVGDIEINPKHLAEITSLDQLAIQNDMRITFVGVENADQYILLRDMDKRCNCQGYHFYKPLDDYKLIEELRKNK